MYAFQRRDKLLTLLKDNGLISVNKDAARLGVSKSTLHRDLEHLQNLGIVEKVRGGARLCGKGQFETHFDIRLKTMPKQKQEIARAAGKAVMDDAAVFLDHSSTALYLARELKKRSFRNLILLTNSLVVPDELGGQRGIRIILTGGTVESEFKALSGRLVVETLRRFNLHQIFASVGAVSLEHGLMTQIPFIHELLPEIFHLGGEINILVDSSKFHKIAAFQVAQLGPPIRLFTNAGIPENIKAGVEETGTAVIVPDVRKRFQGHASGTNDFA